MLVGQSLFKASVMMKRPVTGNEKEMVESSHPALTEDTLQLMEANASDQTIPTLLEALHQTLRLYPRHFGSSCR